MNNKPFVSVSMITYNHEQYISKAIEGVLIQKTNFKFELVIGEDCSTDSTREIVFDYANKYSDIIKVIVSKENVGMQKNDLRTYKKCQGKYIAFCEGDDYWTDPHKLQKQVDFLESNSEYSMCSHEVKTIFEGGVEPRDPFVKPLRSASFEEIIDRGLFIPSLSMVFRRSAIPELPDWYLKLWEGHHPLIYMATQSGKNYHFDDIMAVKRRNPGGITQDKKRIAYLKKYKTKNQIFFFKKLNEWSKYKNKKIIYREIAKKYKHQIKIDLKDFNFIGIFKSMFAMTYYAFLWTISSKSFE
ncbi:MAG: glycosyltransferase [Candidatus Marinimicrobia bacterium]|nr:glycosyltransferase [Candidatus Neomarinimicrobiota bacterium]